MSVTLAVGVSVGVVVGIGVELAAEVVVQVWEGLKVKVFDTAGKGSPVGIIVGVSQAVKIEIPSIALMVNMYNLDKFLLTS